MEVARAVVPVVRAAVLEVVPAVRAAVLEAAPVVRAADLEEVREVRHRRAEDGGADGETIRHAEGAAVSRFFALLRWS